MKITGDGCSVCNSGLTTPVVRSSQQQTDRATQEVAHTTTQGFQPLDTDASGQLGGDVAVTIRRIEAPKEPDGNIDIPSRADLLEEMVNILSNKQQTEASVKSFSAQRDFLQSLMTDTSQPAAQSA